MNEQFKSRSIWIFHMIYLQKESFVTPEFIFRIGSQISAAGTLITLLREFGGCWGYLHQTDYNFSQSLKPDSGPLSGTPRPKSQWPGDHQVAWTKFALSSTCTQVCLAQLGCLASHPTPCSWPALSAQAHAHAPSHAQVRGRLIHPCPTRPVWAHVPLKELSSMISTLERCRTWPSTGAALLIVGVKPQNFRNEIRKKDRMPSSSSSSQLEMVERIRCDPNRFAYLRVCSKSRHETLGPALWNHLFLGRGGGRM